METVADFIFGGSKITVDVDCSHETKRHLFLGREVMTNLDSIFKSRDITLSTKVYLVKAIVFPAVMCGCESWTIKKAERWRIDAFELWCWRRLLRVSWTARRSNQEVNHVWIRNPSKHNPETPLSQSSGGWDWRVNMGSKPKGPCFPMPKGTTFELQLKARTGEKVKLGRSVRIPFAVYRVWLSFASGVPRRF